jgi:hypothetical protein
LGTNVRRPVVFQNISQPVEQFARFIFPQSRDGELTDNRRSVVERDLEGAPKVKLHSLFGQLVETAN